MYTEIQSDNFYEKSSIKNIKLEGEYSNIVFKECNIDSFELIKCVSTNIVFINCNIGKFAFHSSAIEIMSVTESNVGLIQIEDTTLNNCTMQKTKLQSINVVKSKNMELYMFECQANTVDICDSKINFACNESQLNLVNISETSLQDLQLNECKLEKLLLNGVAKHICLNKSNVIRVDIKNSALDTFKLFSSNIENYVCNHVNVGSWQCLNSTIDRVNLTNSIIKFSEFLEFTTSQFNVEKTDISSSSLNGIFKEVQFINSNLQHCKFNNALFEKLDINSSSFVAALFLNVEVKRIYDVNSTWLQSKFNNNLFDQVSHYTSELIYRLKNNSNRADVWRSNNHVGPRVI
jgi:uncharacterized protein YjbI with pentapeptide repeats